jgi:hypothetical protein
LILLSFNINPGPPPGATTPELVKFGEQHYSSVLLGAWLQAVGPLLMSSRTFLMRKRNPDAETQDPRNRAMP